MKVQKTILNKNSKEISKEKLQGKTARKNNKKKKKKNSQPMYNIVKEDDNQQVKTSK